MKIVPHESAAQQVDIFHQICYNLRYEHIRGTNMGKTAAFPKDGRAAYQKG